MISSIFCIAETVFKLQVQEMVGKTVEKGPNYVADPSGLRIGNPPDEKMAEVLQQEALKLEEYISKVEDSYYSSLVLFHIQLFYDFIPFQFC